MTTKTLTHPNELRVPLNALESDLRRAKTLLAGGLPHKQRVELEAKKKRLEGEIEKATSVWRDGAIRYYTERFKDARNRLTVAQEKLETAIQESNRNASVASFDAVEKARDVAHSHISVIAECRARMTEIGATLPNA